MSAICSSAKKKSDVDAVKGLVFVLDVTVNVLNPLRKTCDTLAVAPSALELVPVWVGMINELLKSLAMSYSLLINLEV
jgi:hypothetical protein